LKRESNVEKNGSIRILIYKRGNVKWSAKIQQMVISEVVNFKSSFLKQSNEWLVWHQDIRSNWDRYSFMCPTRKIVKIWMYDWISLTIMSIVLIRVQHHEGFADEWLFQWIVDFW
jgi:hypothetical protein